MTVWYIITALTRWRVIAAPERTVLPGLSVSVRVSQAPSSNDLDAMICVP